MSPTDRFASDPSPETTAPALRRRDVLVGAGALASLAAAGAARAAEETGHHGAHAYTPGVANKKHPELVAAAWDCIAKGEACLSHCMETFVAGDTTMAECAASVESMLPVCGALVKLAVRDSKQLPLLARACAALCEDCEKACREHADHQQECKAAADACKKLAAEAKKIAG